MSDKRLSLVVLERKEREEIGGFSRCSKLPWLSWSIPATLCKTGSKLRRVEGSVCERCYVYHGHYSRMSVRRALERRFKKLKNLRRWKREMVEAIGERAARFTPTDGDPWPAFRWFDSGDLQSVDHLKAICDIALALPHVRFWLPTHEIGIVTQFRKGGGVSPPNLCVRLSAAMVDGPPPRGLGLPVSTVRSCDEAPEGAYPCPAPRQGNQCQSCRACWSNDVQWVDYKLH